MKDNNKYFDDNAIIIPMTAKESQEEQDRIEADYNAHKEDWDNMVIEPLD